MKYYEVPDPPDSYYHPFFNPAGEPDDSVLCDCGHYSDEYEVTEIEGLTYCVNCANARNTAPAGARENNETGRTL